ncbi:MAG: MFS transporter, partial [Pirellulaceae bacterium]|nr:MFS transporter [Pirellulaceae bacterium]
MEEPTSDNVDPAVAAGQPVGEKQAASAELHLASPPLANDRAFWGMTATQFFGAFNDNVFKQILLLIFATIPAGNGKTVDYQWLATLMFALPFILFSGFAGFLSDRFNKRLMIVLCKVGEIVIMSLGVVAFYIYARTGMTAALMGALCAILFCMGGQSAFFGPGKYGILPEMLRRRDLPSANGVILMTTFLAIILGSALAGELKQTFQSRLWVAGGICVGIAIVGTMTSLLLRNPPAARPGLRFTAGALGVPGDLLQLLWKDRALRAAVVVSTIFWMTAALVQMAVNSLGLRQLGLGDRRTSILVSLISLGIAIGCAIAGVASKNRFNTKLMRIGIWGMVVCLVGLAIPAPAPRNHLLGFAGSIVALIALGSFTGMFAVPLQVFMQSRPPEGFKGRMIATQS